MIRFLTLCLLGMIAQSASAADTIYTGGRFYTGASAGACAAALAVSEGTIVAVGDEASLMAHAKEGTLFRECGAAELGGAIRAESVVVLNCRIEDCEAHKARIEMRISSPLLTLCRQARQFRDRF